MPHTKRIRHKRRTTFQKKLGIGVFILAIALLPLVVYSFLNPSSLAIFDWAKKSNTNVTEGLGTKSDLASQNRGYKDITEIEDASSEIDGKWHGLCRKNSIKSVEDFQRTVLNDKVLLAHYSDFDWNNASLGKRDEATLAFVSHRNGDVIKKTSKPIKLPKGDGYITDGKKTARTFCCNDIILAPAAGPPPEDVLLEPGAGIPPVEDVAQAPQILPLATVPVVGGTYPPRGGRTIFRNPPPPPTTPVPEPTTLILFAAGLLGLVIITWKKKSKNKKK